MTPTPTITSTSLGGPPGSTTATPDSTTTHTASSTLAPLPLEFRSPRWYHANKRPQRCPGNICWHHDEVCHEIEMRLLKTPEQWEAEYPIRRAGWEERHIKIGEVNPQRKKEAAEAAAEEEKRNEEMSKKILEREEQFQQAKRLNQVLFPLPPIVEQPTFKVGQNYSVSDLLSSPTGRDYLINKDGHQVTSI